MARPLGKSLEEKIQDGFKSAQIKNTIVREFIAEFLGTMILIIFGDGTVAQVVLSDQLGMPKGSFFTINWGYAMAVTMGIFVSGGVSGGHINPAVSVAFAVIGKFSWKKVPYYILAQYMGAIIGSLIVFTTYYDAFMEVTVNGTNYATPGTAGIFATYPSEHLSYGGAITDQLVGTALLLLMVSAIIDPRNMKLAQGLIPFFIGIVVFNIGTCFGFNCGYAINPARDLGPRIFTVMAGWGFEPFTYGNHYWVVPVIACHVGAIIGVLIYQFGIDNNWPRLEDEEKKAQNEVKNEEEVPAEELKMLKDQEVDA